MSSILRGGRTPVAPAVAASAGSAASVGVSVVVAVTDASAPFLAECLHSLTAHPRPDEVLLALSSSGADTDALVERAVDGAAAEGLTVRVAASDVGDAVKEVTGGWLVVLDAGDVLAPAVLGSLRSSLEASGSDVAVLGPRRARGTTLAGYPDAVASLDLASVLLRLPLWHDAELAEARAAAPWLAACRTLLRASRIDVVPAEERTQRPRGTGAAFSAQPSVASMRRLLPEMSRLMAELEPPELRPVRERVARWLLVHELAGHLRQAEACGPDDWRLLVEVARRLTGSLPSGPASLVPVEVRTAAWLAAEDRRAELVAFSTGRWEDEGDFPTQLRDGAVVAVLPVSGVPLDVLTVSAAEAPLVTRIGTARWVGAGELELGLVAFTRLVGREKGPAAVGVALVADDGQRLPLHAEPVPSSQVDLLAGERHHDHSDGLYRVRVDARALLDAASDGWSLHVTWSRGAVRREATVREVDSRGSAAELAPYLRGGFEIRLDPRTGRVLRRPAQARVATSAASEVTDVALEGDALVVSGVVAGDAGKGVRLRLRGRRGSTAVRLPDAAGPFTVRLPLRHDQWGLGEAPLPSGGYRLRLRGRDGRARALRLGGAAASRVPFSASSAVFRVDVERAPDGSPQVVLGAPLADDDLGARAQHELRRWYVEQDRPCDPGLVYLQAYHGQAVTDSPLAIHRELRRVRPDLRLVWAAADSSVTVPEGAERVVVRSRDWYAALATCGHVVTNVDMGKWFRKRPGQRLLQTSHGYPGKAVGIGEWEAKNLTAGMIESQLRRTAGTWDLLLSPHPAMEHHLRQQYRYDGAILSSGSPRDDELLGPGAGRLREQVRRRLGLEGRTAVLYAPTWRDDLTTGHRTAVLPPTFDVAAAAELLGDDFVVLLRGHRFHRQRRVDGRVVDVTDYPEVNHLVLAADAGVLDYSSLRFDMALTGRPMIFLVPDLRRYERETRGFLYDFRSSAPGPLLDTTAEVVEALRDLPAVVREHAAAYRDFNLRFNTLQDGRSAERVVQAFFGPAPQG